MAIESDFRALTGFVVLAWQKRLYQEHFAKGDIPSAVDVPTGKHVIQLGHKTYSHAIRDCSSGYLDLQDVVASTLRAKGAA